MVFTSELLDWVAHLAHAHVTVCHHSEGVELTTGQVEKGAAAQRRFTCGVNACC